MLQLLWMETVVGLSNVNVLEFEDMFDGSNKVRDIVTAASKMGLESLTLYAFSTEKLESSYR